MLAKKQLDELLMLIDKVNAIHSEFLVIVKKNPDKVINSFKLTFVNQVIDECNSYLGKQRLPLDGFSQFDSEELPSGSDVTFIVSQYMSALESYRCENIIEDFGEWYFTTKEKDRIKTYPPKRNIGKG